MICTNLYNPYVVTYFVFRNGSILIIITTVTSFETRKESPDRRETTVDDPQICYLLSSTMMVGR